MPSKFCFAIDRGGTFTDVYCQCPGGKIRVMKLLSVDPANYPDAPREGIRRILESETGIKMPPQNPIDTSLIEWIRMGTTVATNALLERKGERMALVVTKGFKDVLFIGNQARPKLFDLEIVCPEVLYEEVVEVEERMILKNDKCELEKTGWRNAVGTTGEEMHVSSELAKEKLENNLRALKERGINSLACVLMHSYMNGEHEKIVGEIARKIGFGHVSLSSQVMPMVRIVPRGFTACADAYLTPAIKKYLTGFSSGFQNNLAGTNVLFMQSDGGLTPMDTFNGSRAILSGPAGGVVGYAMTSFQKETDLPVIGFDMGGTSTDVSRYAGSYEHVFESTTAGVTIQAPQLDVNTVAAGGGSMLFFRSGLFVVGPESASAHPGPVCYRKGGPLAITDANLCLGRILPEYFPKIFGPSENEPLDKAGSIKAFESLTSEINDFDKSKVMTKEEVAMGYIAVANEAMCRPIRALTQGKGYDTSRHALACFGGAGGQHACAIARALGMSTVIVHKYAGILSAFGMALADVVHEEQVPAALKYSEESQAEISKTVKDLEDKCRIKLKSQGFTDSQLKLEPFLHMRYQGTDCALMCSGAKGKGFMEEFLDRYKTEFGFVLQNREVFIDDIRVRGTGASGVDLGPDKEASSGPPVVEKEARVYFEGGYQQTKIILMEKLSPGHVIAGPAIIMDQLSTILVEPNCTASVTARGDLKILIGSGGVKKVGKELDTIQLSIFSHRFMSIAEQMGRILQRTSISTNIKERLDFSCALFGPDGGLVSNAPHIPVHLGAMQDTVRHQMRYLGSNLKRGDVILANHPKAGGSHLPDLTIITPVFYKDLPIPVFFVANRGHHADIGGISPGSMPPHSKHLWQEGASFKSFKIVNAGQFQEAELTAHLNAPSQYPGCSGTRLLQDNLSDLKAQIAANHKGIQLVNELIDQYTLEVVQAYMGHIQANAEVAVRDMLKVIGEKAFQRTGQSVLIAEDAMDDGSPIKLKVYIDTTNGEAVFDFAGTGSEVYGNMNAPKAVSMSAIIYCLRCLVGHDIPLNQGCLNPVTVKIPPGSLLDPSEDAAVVGGNVLTSQRIVDVVFLAFSGCAASQGCMNNITFGDENFGYYETVAGGSGAGPTWNGRSGVHTHMTNTRLTDPEILERRYPIVLNQFSLAEGTGGAGKFQGGDGVLRELVFRKPLDLSVLTERRVLAPYGMAGGMPGSKGLNTLVTKSGRVLNLGGKCSVPVKAGDLFRLQTPGGGGWGADQSEQEDMETGEVYVGNGSGKPVKKRKVFTERGSVFEYQQQQHSA
eukprot:TRINITY_DN4705_c0_g1_i1.p1 TRINITY_DN4705_c0_g1~~TRINITY_DN4705_c0_g1_i1.p1  ORF type:complete len:1288 (+),score=342.01 TRINITY_DN4705_c0_g1_i1:47-3910(+)